MWGIFLVKGLKGFFDGKSLKVFITSNPKEQKEVLGFLILILEFNIAGTKKWCLLPTRPDSSGYGESVGLRGFGRLRHNSE